MDIKDLFIESKYDSYGKNQYRSFMKLSVEEKEKIEDLKNHLGEVVVFKRGKAEYKMIVMAVSLPDRTYTIEEGRYKSYPYQFRLNYQDYQTNITRMWDGIWSSKINNIKPNQS